MTRHREKVVLVIAALSFACERDRGAGASEVALTHEERQDPAACRSCHPRHYREWASSMHAYASLDPVFRAMNRRGQRETNGALGSFCVKCHAPMALRDGLTEDGQNLGELPASVQGVTCFFCHSAKDVTEHFNAGIVLSGGDVLTAGVVDPVDPGAHRAGYSPLHDRNRPESSVFCGSCHDVVTPSGVHLERTLLEYQGSLFAGQEGFETCQGCHMDGRPGQIAAVSDAPVRTVHEHLFAGVDVALSDAPDRDVQRKAVECALATSARVASIALDAFGALTVRVETNAGHHQPSGAAQDRRLWLEVVAYDKADQVVFQSGTIADGELEERAPGDPNYDRQLVLFRDWTYDAGGNPAHEFWQVAPSMRYAEGYRSLVLPAAVQPNTPHSIAAAFQLGSAAAVARITVRLRMRPIGRDVLDELVLGGDLEQDVADAMQTFTLHGAAVEWTPDAPGDLRSLWPAELDCPDAYRNLL